MKKAIIIILIIIIVSTSVLIYLNYLSPSRYFSVLESRWHIKIPRDLKLQEYYQHEPAGWFGDGAKMYILKAKQGKDVDFHTDELMPITEEQIELLNECYFLIDNKDIKRINTDHKLMAMQLEKINDNPFETLDRAILVYFETDDTYYILEILI